MIKRFFRPALMLLAFPMLALPGCATVSPEVQLRTGLVDAGLPPSVAGCMAERMVDRLSITQLKKLKSLASMRDARIEEMTVGQFLHKVRGLQDLELLEVTTRAGVGCAIIG